MQANCGARRLAYLRPAEIITVGYCFFLSLLIILHHGNLQKWWAYVMAHSLGAVGIVCLAKFSNHSKKRWLIYVRDWYLAFLFIPMFEEMDVLVPALSSTWVNQSLIKADYWIFGSHPSLMLERITTPWLTEYLMFCFSTVYLLPYVYGVIIYFRNGRERYHHLLFAIALGFYICYIVFLALPAEGPWVTMKDMFTAKLNGGIFTRLVEQIEAAGSVRGAAFPSSHIMLSFVVLLFARRYNRILYFVFLPIILGLFLATVYCRFHYAVDVFGGLLAAGIAFGFANKINQRGKFFVEKPS